MSSDGVPAAVAGDRCGSLVWAPLAVYLGAPGAVWQGLALAAWGLVVILVDNLLRPVLVGKETRLPDDVVLITTLGGMAVFGVHGFALGPAIVAMFLAVWHIVVMRRSGSRGGDGATRGG